MPVEVGDAEPTMELCERLLERGVFAQGIRPPTVPEGSSRLRFTVMATHARGRAASGAAKLVGDGRPRARDRRGPAPAAPLAEPMRRATAIFVTGTGTEVGKTVVAAVIARTLAATGSDGRRLQARGDRPRRAGGEADHELLRRASGSAQSDEEIAPYRYGPPVSPHLAAELAGERDRARAAARRRPGPPADGADVLVCEGVGGLLVPLSRRATWCATSPSTSGCRW